MADISFNINSDDLSKLDKILKDLQKSLKNISKSPIVNQDQAVQTKKIATEMLKIENARKREELASKRIADQQSKLNQKLKESKGIIGGLENEARKLRSQLRAATDPKDIARLNKKLDETRRKMTQAKGTTASWGKALGSFQFKFNALGNIAANVVSRINRELVKALKNTVVIVKDFDQAMADVRAVSNANDVQMQKLIKSARELGGTTKFTATQVAGLQKEYSKLGFTTEEILNAQEATLSLAAATGTDLARSAEVVGTTLKQFSLDASEAGRVTDLMAKSFTKSALDTERFAEAMKMVGPDAKQANISLEETTAMLAVLADAGISGSMAGTSLRKILVELIGAGGNLSEKLQKLSKEGLNLAGANDEVGARAKTSLLILLDQLETLPKLTKEFENAGGAAKTMADIQLDTLAGKVTELKSAWEGLILTIQSGTDTLEGTKKGIAAITEVIQELNKETAAGKGLEFLFGGFGLSGSQGSTNTSKIKSQQQLDFLKYQEMEQDGISEVNRRREEEIANIKTKVEQEKIAAAEQEKRDKAYIEAARELLNQKKLEIEANETIYNAQQKVYENTTNKKIEGLKLETDATIEALLTEDEAFIQSEELKTEKLQEEAEKRKSIELEKIRETEEARKQLIRSGFDLAFAISNKIAEKDKETAEGRKRIAIREATISQAEGIANIWSKWAANPVVAGALTALALTTFGVQISTIKKQKFAKGGEVHGALHSQGGVNAELEGGEYVINRRSASKHKKLLEGINENDQLKILMALDQDRNPKKSIADPWTKKIYEQLASQEIYGETNDFYIVKKGNRKVMIRKK